MSSITSKTCRVSECGRPVHGHGLCDTHSKRYRLYGDPLHGGRIKIKDGRTKDPLFNRWADMISRCNNPNSAEYPRYGGRGISVCPQWLDDFAVFKRDMGEPPTPKHQLDRIDNDKGYTPENCRWSTRSVNCFNRDSSRPAESGYLNVYIHKRAPRMVYRVVLKHQGIRVIDLGLFSDKDEAAWMSDQFRLGLWGDEARLNFEYV